MSLWIHKNWRGVVSVVLLMLILQAVIYLAAGEENWRAVTRGMVPGTMSLPPIIKRRRGVEALLRYRQHLRQLLFEHGVMSNPGVDDDWIIQQLRRLLAPPQRIRTDWTEKDEAKS